jgi:protein-S-isoprenylcysteine O-methyltransferase Ste14
VSGDATKKNARMGYLLGIAIQFIVPVTINSATFLEIIRVLGILLVAAGAVFMAWPQSIFRKHQTTTVPHSNFYNIRELGSLSI